MIVPKLRLLIAEFEASGLDCSKASADLTAAADAHARGCPEDSALPLAERSALIDEGHRLLKKVARDLHALARAPEHKTKAAVWVGRTARLGRG